MVHHDTQIKAEDHLILVVTDKRHVNNVEKLSSGSHLSLIFREAQYAVE